MDDIDAADDTSVAGGDDTAGLYRVALPPGSDPSSILAQLRSTPGVAYAEPDQAVQVPEAQQSSRPFYEATATSSTYMGQYALNLVGAPAAHAFSSGQGVTVAVLDTGVVFTHTALAGHLLPGYDVLDPDAPPLDVPSTTGSNAAVGHGTGVAGIIAAVAPDARIMPIKVLGSDGWGTEFGLVEGIRYAVDHGAQVINLSLGMTSYSRAVADALDYAAEHDVTVVAAAGNTGTTTLTYPASDPNVLAVAATDANDDKATFSAYGPSIGLSAPGVDILSTYYNGGYALWSGTSVAAPFVSGEAALVRAAFPDDDASAVVEQMQESAVPIDALNPAYAGDLGAGRIDLLAAVSTS